MGNSCCSFSWDKQDHQPYLLTNGLNTSNGVKEGDCRYISIKVKAGTFSPGDVNGDGKVTDADLTKLLRYVAKIDTLSEAELSRANVDQDANGSINGADVTAPAKYLNKS